MSTLDTSGRVLTGWNPEEPENWSAKIAWTTLTISTYSMILAFCVWLLPSAIAPKPVSYTHLTLPTTPYV